jgi:hypothetical protein
MHFCKNCDQFSLIEKPKPPTKESKVKQKQTNEHEQLITQQIALRESARAEYTALKPYFYACKNKGEEHKGLESKCKN